MATDLDAPTLTAAGESTPALAAERFPTLTILWHPDPSRVGARFSLVDLPKSHTVSLSRRSPTFCGPGHTVAPLSDSFLSREAMLDFQLGNRAITVAARGGGVPVAVNGEPVLQARSIPEPDVGRGVVLTLGRRIALCLHLARPFAPAEPDLGFVGISDAMAAVRHAIRSVSGLAVPVLIRGETGTGKELTVDAIVKSGPRRNKPMIAVNLGALPAPLAAAEIFGHARGAFTGAAAERNGYFHDADGGTLFLDEIGLAPADVQRRRHSAGVLSPLTSNALTQTDRVSPPRSTTSRCSSKRATD